MKRTILAAATALLFAGAAQAAVTEFIIYKQENFRGPSQTVKGEVNNLEGGFAREGSSLIVRGGNWEVCTEHHFRGNCYVLGPGEYPSLGQGLGDRIVAVRFVGNQKAATVDTRNWREAKRDERGDDRRDERRHEERRHARNDGTIDLYGRQDFRGRSLRLDNNERDLARHEFGNRASSVIVHEGVWELCTEPGYRGRCRVFEPGRYESLGRRLEDRISSVRRVR